MGLLGACNRIGRIFWGAVLVAGAVAQAQPGYFIETVAGASRLLGDNGPATSALLWSPQGVSVDAAGNVYIADSGDARIRKVSPSGTITTVAGGTAGFSGDGGQATSAQLSYPAKAVAAPNGDLYIVDTANQRIRRVARNGVITTLSGTGVAGYAGDGGAAAGAQFNAPRDIAVDSSGAVVVVDTNNARLRRFIMGGTISTVAGTGVLGSLGDGGLATEAQLTSPWGIAMDGAGNIYIGDTGNNRVRKITPAGAISTIAGIGGAGGFSGDNAPAIAARLYAPTGVAADSTGNVYICDSGNHRVRKVSSNGIVTTIAGTGAAGFSGDNGPAASAQLNLPESVAVDAAGSLYIADAGNHRVRKISPQGMITTLAGSDPGAGDGGLAANALLFQPSGIAFDSSGNLYIADTSNHRIRRVATDGTITTVAGIGAAGYSGDNGYASRAQLSNPDGIAFDRAGNLYIADTGNHVIRRISGNTISTVAGTGAAGNTGDDGPALSAALFNPGAIAIDASGNLYIADSGNNRIRKVSLSGTISAFAGDSHGNAGYAGDGGRAQSAQFDYPRGLALDSSGNLYVADYFNNRIRKIAADASTITTYAGTGAGGFSGDGGVATEAQLHLPGGLVIDGNNNLYVADLLNDRIRMIGANGVIQTIAGSGAEGDGGDNGPALSAALHSPRAVALDIEGNVYFSDQDNDSVRRLVAQTIAIQTVVNAASMVAGWVAPGEAVTIFGTRLGPASGASGGASNGVIGSTLAGTRVLFNGTPAPLLYAGLGQINAIVPYQVAGQNIVTIRVEVEGLTGEELAMAARDAAPGIFTVNQSGQGQAAAVNQDGTLNSAANPVDRGSIVSLYVTGEGQTTPPGSTGQLIGTNPLPKPNLAVTVQVQGIAADILYAGEAPFSAGLMQVNVRVPANVLPGSQVPVNVIVGTFPAQPGVTIAVR